MSCSHIVECLKNQKIEPEIFTGSENNDNKKATNAFEYNTNSFFRTGSGNKEQWWAVHIKALLTF